MSHYRLAELAGQLPEAWKFSVIACIGDAKVRLMRMDALAYPEEIHDYAEGLLVVDGQLQLRIANQLTIVRTGELLVVPAGTPHTVEPGSIGALLIIDL